MKAVVIGCGRMGDRLVSALTNLDIKVVGIYDTNIESSTKVSEKHSLPLECVKNSLNELLSLKPEIAVIATTAPSHEQLILKCINSGIKKILCEKPLAVSVSECKNILKVADEQGVDIAVNHQMRFMDQYIVPKQMLNSEEFGGIQSIHVTAGNFGMAMNGLHYIEMMRFMFDEAPSSITAWFDDVELPNPRGEQFKDKSGELRLSTDSGKVFTLNARASNGHGLIVQYVAKYGQITVDELSGNMYWTVRNLSERELPTTRYGQPHSINTDKVQGVDIISSTESVVKALLVGKGYPNLHDATTAVRSLVAGYISNENNNVSIAINDNKVEQERKFPWA